MKLIEIRDLIKEFFSFNQKWIRTKVENFLIKVVVPKIKSLEKNVCDFKTSNEIISRNL